MIMAVWVQYPSMKKFETWNSLRDSTIIPGLATLLMPSRSSPEHRYLRPNRQVMYFETLISGVK
jgi:hypothetical protein